MHVNAKLQLYRPYICNRSQSRRLTYDNQLRTNEIFLDSPAPTLVARLHEKPIAAHCKNKRGAASEACFTPISRRVRPRLQMMTYASSNLERNPRRFLIYFDMPNLCHL